MKNWFFFKFLFRRLISGHFSFWALLFKINEIHGAFHTAFCGHCFHSSRLQVASDKFIYGLLWKGTGSTEPSTLEVLALPLCCLCLPHNFSIYNVTATTCGRRRVLIDLPSQQGRDSGTSVKASSPPYCWACTCSIFFPRNWSFSLCEKTAGLYVAYLQHGLRDPLWKCFLLAPNFRFTWLCYKLLFMYVS